MSQNLFNDVALFLRTAEKPGGPGHREIRLEHLIEATRHVGEELIETNEALANFLMVITTSNNTDEHDAAMARLADGFLDSIYTAANGLWALGLDPQPLWDIVQAANMAKMPQCAVCFGSGDVEGRVCDFCGGKGRLVTKNAAGKVQKPDGWTPPDLRLADEVTRQLKEAGDAH